MVGLIVAFMCLTLPMTALAAEVAVSSGNSGPNPWSDPACSGIPEKHGDDPSSDLACSFHPVLSVALRE